MPTGPWCLLAIAMFCASTAAASPSKVVQPDQRGSPATERKAVERRVDRSAETSAANQNVACGPGQDNRNSDLCAQWKAADAAYGSAVWTRRTFYLEAIGALIGLATLGAAIAAAAFAKRAADETRRTADAANEALGLTERISAAELKPLIAIKVVPVRTGYKDGIVFVDALIELTNLGGTEAINLNIVSELLHSSEHYLNDAQAILLKGGERKNPKGLSIFPNETLTHRLQFMERETEIKFFNINGDGPSIAFMFVVGAHYQSTFSTSEEWISVERIYTLGYKSSLGIVFTFFQKDKLNLPADRIVAQRVQ